MNNTKPWYTSRTIWGSIIALLSGVLSTFGFDIDDGTQAAFIDVALQLVAVGGSLMAVAGRVSATSMIE